MDTSADMTGDSSADTDRDSPDRSDLVTAEEAAQLVGVTARTVRRWIERGRLAAIESDRGRLVSAAAVRELQPPAAAPSPRTGTGTPAATDTDMPEDVRPASEALTTQIAELERAIDRLELDRDRWHEAFVEEQGQVRALQVLLATEQEQSRALRAALADTERQLEALTAGDAPSETSQHSDHAPREPETGLGAPEGEQTGDSTSAQEAGQESRLRRSWEWLKRH